MESKSTLFRGKPALFTVPLVLILAWTVVDVLGIVFGGFVSIDAYWVVGLVAKLAILVVNLWFVKAFFIDGRHELYGALRKYAGYGVVLGYSAICLPTMAWQLDGLINESQAFFFWSLCAMQAVLMMALWVSLRIKKAQVFWGVITQAEAGDKKLLQQHLRGKKRSPLGIVLENVDMFIQTVFIVIVLQQFIFQLYVIPSESMVPTLLDGDRPLIVKSLDGPTIPMSSVKFPAIATIQRGQIVVFENPVYQRPPLSIQVFQQFLFYLTLSLVDLDKDENGNPKVHFIVKRVTGVPGEKLMMIDDKLYVKTSADANFRLQEQDALYRHTDLWKEPESIRARIKNTLIGQTERTILNRWDQKKNELNSEAASQELKTLGTEIESSLQRLGSARLVSLSSALSSGTVAGDMEAFRSHAAVWKAYNILPWQETGVTDVDAGILEEMAADASLRADFRNFLGSSPAIKDGAPQNAYDSMSKNANLLWKTLIARHYQAVLALATRGANATAYADDAALRNSNQDIKEFQLWLQYYDYRNFPEYPEESNHYIPEGKYFLMGDNRYNSLDFRYDAENTTPHTRSLEAADPHSLVYASMLKMRLLDRSYIIGHLAFRLFPFDRFGLVKP